MVCIFYEIYYRVSVIILCSSLWWCLKYYNNNHKLFNSCNFCEVCCHYWSGVLEWQTVSALTSGLFWCLFPELQGNKGNRYQNNTWVNAETVHQESTCTFCWWRHNWLLMTSQWADNCDAITSIVIPNALNIDFIRWNIHSWLFKKKISKEVELHTLSLEMSCAIIELGQHWFTLWLVIWCWVIISGVL